MASRAGATTKAGATAAATTPETLSAAPTRNNSSSDLGQLQAKPTPAPPKQLAFLEHVVQRLSGSVARPPSPIEKEQADMRALFDLLLLQCGSEDGSRRLGWAGFQLAFGAASWNAPLVKRMFDVIDREGRGSLSCEDFAAGLQPLYSHLVPVCEKEAFVFSCFDLDGDGTVSRAELTVLLSCMGAGSGRPAELSEAQVEQVADATFVQMRRGESGGGITLADFAAHFAARPAARRALLASVSFQPAALTSRVWLSLGPQWFVGPQSHPREERAASGDNWPPAALTLLRGGADVRGARRGRFGTW